LKSVKSVGSGLRSRSTASAKDLKGSFSRSFANLNQSVASLQSEGSIPKVPSMKNLSEELLRRSDRSEKALTRGQDVYIVQPSSWTDAREAGVRNAYAQFNEKKDQGQKLPPMREIRPWAGQQFPSKSSFPVGPDGAFAAHSGQGIYYSLTREDAAMVDRARNGKPGVFMKQDRGPQEESRQTQVRQRSTSQRSMSR
jgi:hypothetical protein